jgi:hypothetical protein
MLAVDGAPDLEPFMVGGQRADARMGSVGNDQNFVVVEKGTYLLLIRLQLLERRPNGGVFIGRILQFKHREWQAIDEDHDIRPPVVLPLDNRELVHSQPVVDFRMIKIDQAHPVPGDATVDPAIFDFYAITQHGMKVPIRVGQ